MTKVICASNQQFNKNWEFYLQQLQSLQKAQDEQLWLWIGVQHFKIDSTCKKINYSDNNKTNLLLSFLKNARSKLMTTSCSILTRLYLSENSKNTKEQAYLLQLAQQLASDQYLIKLINSANKIISSAANELIKTILISVNFAQNNENIDSKKKVNDDKIRLRIIRNFMEQFVGTKNNYVRQQISMYFMVIFSEIGPAFLKHLITTLQESQIFNMKLLGKISQSITIQSVIKKGLTAKSSKVRQNMKQVRQIIQSRLSQVQNTRFFQKDKPNNGKSTETNFGQQNRINRSNSVSFRNSINKSIIKQSLQDSSANQENEKNRIKAISRNQHQITNQDCINDLKLVYSNISNQSSNWIAKSYQINMFFDLLDKLLKNKQKKNQVAKVWRIQYVKFLIQLLSERKSKLNIRASNFFRNIFHSIKQAVLNDSYVENTINLSCESGEIIQSFELNGVKKQKTVEFFKLLLQDYNLRQQFLMQLVKNWGSTQENIEQIFQLFIELANYQTQIAIFIINQINRILSQQDSSFTRKHLVNLMDMLIMYFLRAETIVKTCNSSLVKFCKQLLASLKKIFVLSKYRDKKDITLPALTLFSQLKSINCSLTNKQFAKFPKQAIQRIVLLAKQIDPSLQKQLMSAIKFGRKNDNHNQVIISKMQIMGLNREAEAESRIENYVIKQIRKIKKMVQQSGPNGNQQISWCLQKLSKLLFECENSIQDESLVSNLFAQNTIKDLQQNCYLQLLSLLSLLTDQDHVAEYRIILSYLCQPIQTQRQVIKFRTNYLKALFNQVMSLGRSLYEQQQSLIYCSMLLSLINAFLKHCLESNHEKDADFIVRIYETANRHIQGLIQIYRIVPNQTNFQVSAIEIKRSIMHTFKYLDKAALKNFMRQDQFSFMISINQQ